MKQEMMGWQWHQLDHMQISSRQITMPAPHRSIFYRPDDLKCSTMTNSVSEETTNPFVSEEVECNLDVVDPVKSSVASFTRL